MSSEPKKLPLSAAKRLKKAVSVLIGLLLGGVVILWSLALIFEKDVLRFATQKLNERLKSEISYESADFTILKTFPFASLEFKNVTCPEYVPGKKNPEPLFQAAYLYFQFNVLDLIRGNYSVKRITLKGADLRLVRDKKGAGNWEIWENKPEAPTEKEKFRFRISAVRLENVSLTYVDHKEDISASADLKKVFLSGNFTENNYKLSAETDFRLNGLSWKNTRLPGPVKLVSKATLQVNKPAKKYEITYGFLALNKMELGTEGSLTDTEEGLLTDLLITGKRLNLGEIIDLVPARYAVFRENYRGEGEVNLNGRIKGLLHAESMPETNWEFDGEGIRFTARQEKISASDIRFRGTLTTDSEGEGSIKIGTFFGRLPQSEVQGSLTVSGFKKPVWEGSISVKADLEELFSFFPADTLQEIGGKMNAELQFKIRTGHGGKTRAEHFQHASVKGVVSLSGTRLWVKKSPFLFENVEGEIEFNQTDVLVKELAGLISGSDFRIKGQAFNLLPFLFLPNQTLKITADLESKRIYADRFFAAEETDTKTEQQVSLPGNISLYLNASIGQLNFRKFEAREIRGNIGLDNRVLSALGVKMKTLGGSAFFSGLADNSDPKKLAVAGSAELKDVNVTDLFFRFNNFGQDALQHNHIKGVLQAKAEFKLNLNEKLETDLPSVFVKADMEIDNGELSRFEPLKALAGWARVEELDNVRFAKLKNTVYIKNEAVLIPEMAIYSNALDLNIAGEHRFDNTVEYGFNLFLGDILANKFRINRRPDKQGEFGELIPDKGRTRIFVRMHGPMDNLQFSYDKSAVKQKIQQDINNEKETLKTLFDSEFGKIKSDSLLKDDPYLKEKQEKREKKKKFSEGNDEFQFE